MCSDDDEIPGEFFNERMHVYPTNDIREHILSLDCPCQPVLDEEDNIVYTTHSMVVKRMNAGTVNIINVHYSVLI